MIEITFEQIGLALQVLGVAWVFVAQVAFLGKLWLKWKDWKLAFLDVVATRFMSSDEELRKMNKKERKAEFEKFPLATWLKSNFTESLTGLALTLAGLLVELLMHGSIMV